MTENKTTESVVKPERQTAKHVCNELLSCGVSIRISEKLLVLPVVKWPSDKGTILKDDKIFAEFTYFEGIEQPLFRFRDLRICNIQDKETGKYKLILGPHSQPALILQGKDHATMVAWQTVHRCLTNYTKDPFYELSRNAGAFFQGGGSNPEQEYIYVEFWKYKGAQAWLDAFNDELIIRKNEDLAFRSQGVQS
jgi:hypothetical protein